MIGKLLAVPALRQKYLDYIRDIATNWLDWKKLGPVATGFQALLLADVKTDTRKLYSTEAFEKAVTEETSYPAMGPFGARPHMGLKQFAEQRREFLLEYKEPVKKD